MQGLTSLLALGVLPPRTSSLFPRCLPVSAVWPSVDLNAAFGGYFENRGRGGAKVYRPAVMQMMSSCVFPWLTLLRLLFLPIRKAKKTFYTE